MKKITAICVILLFFFVMYLFDITCPIKAIFGFPCPACGTTRAMMSLLRLDFRSYFNYNPTALLLAVAFFLVLFGDKESKKAINVYAVLVAVLNFAIYVARMFF